MKKTTISQITIIIAIAITHILFLGNEILTKTYAINQTATPATIVLGQDGFDPCDIAPHNGDIEKGFAGMTSITMANGKLIVADLNSERVLIYNSLPTNSNTKPDLVIGQEDLCGIKTNAGGSVNDNTLYGPIDVYYDGQRLFISEWSNNRVLIYNSLPTENFAHADVVVGQPDFTSNTANNGGISARSLYYPYGVFSDGERLLISERGNNRVLIFNEIPTTNFEEADVVIGQPNMTSGTANNGGRTAASLSWASDVTVVDEKIIVADYLNNRVLIYNSIPITNGTSANTVIGQPDMTSGTANNGGIKANTLNRPWSVHSDGTRLLVSDYSNNRVLVYNSIPVTSWVNADYVIGQPNFTSSTANNGGIGANTLSAPASAFVSGEGIIIGDGGPNRRILLYDSLPTANGASADIVLGQLDMVHNGQYQGNDPENSFYLSRYMDSHGDKFLATDYAGNRVFLWNTVPITTSAEVALVIGIWL